MNDFERMEEITKTISEDELQLLDATLSKRVVRASLDEYKQTRDNVFMGAYALCFHMVEYIRFASDKGDPVLLNPDIIKHWIDSWDKIADKNIDLEFETPRYKVEKADAG